MTLRWARFRSTSAKDSIHLAASGPDGPWYLALEHRGIVEELDLPPTDMPGPGLARFAFPRLGDLYGVLPKVYGLGLTLPEGPLEDFRTATRDMPRTTEAERLVVQRVGQGIFRDRLLTYWEGGCPLTGIVDAPLLRASHIVPWTECPTDGERLNIYNGLLLSALWDAAFDKGLVTFDDDGRPAFSPLLSEAAQGEQRWHAPIPLTARHRERLAWHRATLFQKGEK